MKTVFLFLFLETHIFGEKSRIFIHLAEAFKPWSPLGLN